jgi:glycosyltransferase involved in cell wall biosynthesis
MEWSPWDESDQTSFFSDFDVAICPLVDDEGTRGKETFKIKEYMAAGLPQVLSPVGYGLKVIDDGVEGFFAESPEEWFDRLTLLLGDPELRSRMGSAARRRIEADYRFEKMLEGLADVCREAARGGAG